MAEAVNLQITVTRETRGLLRDLARLTTRGEFAELMMPFMQRHATLAAGRITSQQLSGQLLKRRTGRLAGSIMGRAERFQGLPGLRVGTLRGPAVPYAAVHERGGTIRPVRAKALAIPMEAALTPAGVDRFGGPRYAGDLKFIPFRRSGVAVGGLFDPSTLQKGEDGRVDLSTAVMYYLLVREVTLPARHYLEKGFNAYLPVLTKELAAYIRNLLRNIRSQRGGL